MERVHGFGGFFFRAKDPEALAKWYHDNLGILPVPTDAASLPWMAEGGPTVFSPFAADTDYFPADKAFMLNFRVADLDGLLDQLRGIGAEPFNETSMDGIGRFAHVYDPEGNAIELWEPAS